MGIIGGRMTPCKTDLGRFIRARRLELNLKQSDVDEMAGLPKQKVKWLESGRQKYLSQAQLMAIAEAIRCDPDALRAVMPIKVQVTKVKSVKPRRRRKIEPKNCQQVLQAVIPQALPGRPLYKEVGGVKIYISVHDQYHFEKLREFKRQFRKFHPDTSRNVQNMGAVVRRLIKKRKKFLKAEIHWYSQFGLEPPSKTGRVMSLARDPGERLRIA